MVHAHGDLSYVQRQACDQCIICARHNLQISKNLVLAGIGSVTLADDTPVSEASFGNFLVAPGTAADHATWVWLCK